jgi:hypothetical protein
MKATAITISEKAESTTAKEGIKLRKIRKTTMDIPIKDIKTA